jgi:hypothetical protein
MTQKAKDQMHLAPISWQFNWFKCRHAIHNLKTTGKATTADHVAAKEFLTVFKSTAVKRGYIIALYHSIVRSRLLTKEAQICSHGSTCGPWAG